MLISTVSLLDQVHREIVLILDLEVIRENVLYIEAKNTSSIPSTFSSGFLPIPMQRREVTLLGKINILRGKNKLISKVIPKLVISLEVTKASDCLSLILVDTL